MNSTQKTIKNPILELGYLIPEGYPGIPDGWELKTKDWVSESNGNKLFSIRVSRADAAKSGANRTLVVMHGMSEHGGRYLHLPHFLSESIDHLIVFDHQGYGRSGGLRGHIDSMEVFTDDASQMIRMASSEIEELTGSPTKVHVLGHSLGGLILLKTLIRFGDLPIVSATASAPAIDNRLKVPLVTQAIGYSMSRIWSNLQVVAPSDPTNLTHDKNVIKAFGEDKLVHHKGTPGIFVTIMGAMKELRETTPEIPYPILFQVPTGDQVVDPDAILAFFHKLKSQTKDAIQYPGYFHEIYNEGGEGNISKEVPIQDLTKWMERFS